MSQNTASKISGESVILSACLTILGAVCASVDRPLSLVVDVTKSILRYASPPPFYPPHLVEYNDWLEDSSHNGAIYVSRFFGLLLVLYPMAVVCRALISYLHKEETKKQPVQTSGKPSLRVDTTPQASKATGAGGGTSPRSSSEQPRLGNFFSLGNVTSFPYTPLPGQRASPRS